MRFLSGFYLHRSELWVVASSFEEAVKKIQISEFLEN
jgi:hypothetical protein